MTERFHFGGKNGDLPFTVAGGPDYDLWLQDHACRRSRG